MSKGISSIIFALLAVIIFLTKAIGEDAVYDTSGIYYLLFTLALISIAVLDIISMNKSRRITENLKDYKYALKETYVCGYAFSNIEDDNTGAYFELKYEDIRDVRFINPYSSESGQIYTLIIDHKKGTYKLCINGWESAAQNTLFNKSEIEKQKTASEV